MNTGGYKGFFEVFPTIRLPEELRGLFSGASVKTVLKSRNGKAYHIYVSFPSIVEKRDIYKVERELQRQVFSQAEIKAKLHESFVLDGSFEPETVMEVYSDSVSEELAADYPILNQIYKRSKTEYEGNRVLLKVPEEMIFGPEAEKLANNLTGYLSNVFNKRLGIAAEVRLEFESAGISLEREKREEEIKRGFKELMASRAQRREVSEESAAGKEDPKGKPGKRKKAPKSPDVIYKSDFEGEAIPIKYVSDPIGEVIVRGQLFSYDEFLTKGNICVVTLTLTDFTDSIKVKLFFRDEGLEEFKEAIKAEDLIDKKEGIFVKIKGVADFDKYEHDTVITGVRGIKKISSFKEVRVDLNSEKRTELHLHTRFSEMDGVSGIDDMIKTASSWGWKSIAVTDHGNVQAFPVAYKTLGKLKDKDFKVIYGMEGYLVDDTNPILWNAGMGDGKDKHSLNENYVVFDIETTGFSPLTDRKPLTNSLIPEFPFPGR